MHILPVLEEHAPTLFERNATDHAALDARLARIAERAIAMTDTVPGEQRARLHNLYLDLASFTGAYLAHEEFEERIVMPALLEAIGVEGSVGIHHAIVSSIPPPVMAKTLALMIPAMNVDDRAEMLGGMQASAPPQIFEGIWGLANSVLTPTMPRQSPAASAFGKEDVMDIDGAVMVITGAGSGIGAATARAANAAGAHLVLAGRREERITAVADELRAARPDRSALAIPTDVTDPQRP